MIKKHISIYTGVGCSTSKDRKYYVEYEEIDTLERKFVKEKVLLATGSLRKAEEYAKKKAKKLGISYIETSVDRLNKNYD